MNFYSKIFVIRTFTVYRNKVSVQYRTGFRIRSRLHLYPEYLWKRPSVAPYEQPFYALALVRFLL